MDPEMRRAFMLSKLGLSFVTAFGADLVTEGLFRPLVPLEFGPLIVDGPALTGIEVGMGLVVMAGVYVGLTIVANDMQRLFNSFKEPIDNTEPVGQNIIEGEVTFAESEPMPRSTIRRR